MKQLWLFFFILTVNLQADYPDQHRVVRGRELWERISSSTNISFDQTGGFIELDEGVTSGWFILQPDTLAQPFDRGLPSWNGRVFTEDSGFKVFIRFRYGTGWSPWLTVGYWKNHIWPSYGTTSYSRGHIDYDYAVLDDFHTVVQWSVQFLRKAAGDPSPRISKLSFFTSDDRSTRNIDHASILADNPARIFYSTAFVCQYNVDPEIGGSICSPTSTVLAIRSYDIDVDAYDFAVDNYDDYWGMFGIWPRAVQNATCFHLDGAVTRYRTWSQAYDSLAAGGRVVMSVGPPLYSGHLMMLAGFTEAGNPLVHDPARQNGYAYEFAKSDLSHSWFDKGGVAYTFFLDETAVVDVDGKVENFLPEKMTLYQNYPNPFNAATTISFALTSGADLTLNIYDVQGRLVAIIARGFFQAGKHEVKWYAEALDSGIYFLRLISGHTTLVRRITLLK